LAFSILNATANAKAATTIMLLVIMEAP